MKPDSMDSAMGGAQSVDRALALLFLIGRQSASGISLSGLVSVSGLNKATVRRQVLALMRAGLVEQDAVTRSYHLGEDAYLLGLLAQGRHGLLSQAMEQVQRLARDTGDAAFISVRRGLHSVCLHREDGAHPIRTYALMPGAHHPLGVGAGSLAMLAALPDPEIEAVIAANSAELASNYPLLNPDTLRAQVAQTREAGIALNPGLIFEDSWGLGVALHGPDGQLVGAVSIAAVESRMKAPRRAELEQKLRATTRAIEARLTRNQQEKRK
ncbi:IclR family transcriptional regulator [Roseinatronobacter monicus]|uniref:IclR family transcriptional regulator n=1 Tax=Roseinatronobacter monicus TaxID=393481 RepID=UPI003F3D691A